MMAVTIPVAPVVPRQNRMPVLPPCEEASTPNGRCIATILFVEPDPPSRMEGLRMQLESLGCPVDGLPWPTRTEADKVGGADRLGTEGLPPGSPYQVRL